MFGIFKKKYRITINDELRDNLQSEVTEMNTLLMSEGNTYQANWMKKILSAILENNTDQFKNLILSNELLGGSGSVLDCYVGSDQKQQAFDEHFNNFLKFTLDSGLTHRAVKQCERMTRKK